MMEAGFEKANSTNLPNIDVFMLLEFVKREKRYDPAELRLAKSTLMKRETGGQSPVGYVCLRKESSKFTIKGKVSLERRLRSKRCSVTLTVNAKSESIDDVSCEDCQTETGCKQALAFLIWVHCRSEHRPQTEIDCYWTGSVLKTVNSETRSTTAPELVNNKIIDLHNMLSKTVSVKINRIEDENLTGSVLKPVRRRGIKSTKASKLLNKENIDLENIPNNSVSLNANRIKIKKKQAVTSRKETVLKEPQLHALSLNQLLFHFLNSNGASPSEFIEFLTSQMTSTACMQAESETRGQGDDPLWHALRLGRITASTIHEASRCTMKNGSLIAKLLGKSRKFKSVFMQRGLDLEEHVIEVAEQMLKQKFRRSGLILIPNYPIFGASPDAIGDDFVVEIKCPISTQTFLNYINDDAITPKFKAQIHLQMLATGMKKGLFCVADPQFEKNKRITLKWIDYDTEFMNDLLQNATDYWKDCVYPQLIRSIKR